MQIVTLALIDTAVVGGRCDFSLTLCSLCFPVLLAGVCAGCHRDPRGGRGAALLHEGQGGELADLQQAHSQRSAPGWERSPADSQSQSSGLGGALGSRARGFVATEPWHAGAALLEVGVC